jgi:hypothetical protein
MTTEKNTLNSSGNRHAHDETKPPPVHNNPIDFAVANFVAAYNERATFLNEAFIKKLKEGNRKALAELQRYPLPPTRMDLRNELASCLKANIADDQRFLMIDGKVYTMLQLKRLVYEWCSIAEMALMQSDPTLADKLMSLVQWNAKSAFEVAFVTAMNELTEIKKNKKAISSWEHYVKWIINPLKKAIEHVKEVNPPTNSLVGYGNRIPLSKAMVIAENVEGEFEKALREKTK